MSKVKKFLQRLRYSLSMMKHGFYGFYGSYASWEEATKQIGKGYETEEIFEKVKAAIEKVRNGQAVFERDSVVFDKEEYNFPLLTALLYIKNTEGRLSVIDFGGSLGSTFFQNRKLLGPIDYTVVEQRHFVSYGKQHIKEINFEYTIEECADRKANCLLLSGSLEYLPNPYEYLERFRKQAIKYILFDRTPMGEFADKLVLQKVPKDIYDATYPVWLLNKYKIIEKMGGYDIVWEWDVDERMPLRTKFGLIDMVEYKGMLLKRSDGGESGRILQGFSR